MSEERFSVCQYREDGSCEYVRRFVGVDEAVEAFSQRVGGHARVIVTDGDGVNLEWTFRGGMRNPRKAV